MNSITKISAKLVVIVLVLLAGPASSQNLDIRILRSVNSSGNLPSDNFFRFVSNSDAWLVFGIPAAIGSVGLIKHDKGVIRNGCVILTSVVLDGGITEIMKYTFKRDRPFITYPDITKKSRAGSPSFPSGHTSSAFALATSLSLAYPKWYIIASSYTWAGTVAFSRMELGVHYPSDILAGALVGAGSAWLTYAVNKKLLKKPKAIGKVRQSY
jgi:membrane-associated phospholipid phosphatase